MIVFSLVLILVAVALLVLGLTAGSSSLLITSIAASLLAAIALVIGARRAAAARRAGPASFAEPVDPGPEPAPVRRASRRRAATDVMGKGNTPAGAGEPAVETMATGNTPAGAMAEPVAGPDHAEAAAYAAGRRDADEALVSYPDEPLDARDDRDDFADFEGETPPGRRAERDDEPDYEQAAGFIGGARAPEQPRDGIWADDPAAAAPVPVDDLPPATFAGRPADGSGPSAERGPEAAGQHGADFAAGPDLAAGPGFATGPGADPAGGLGEADPDDPEDEPRPQAIRPGDAVRIARMEAEVLVVDGRPRYHLADCPHLIGRQTEGLPAAEAVELGFTPCGLCRPVDRLVAAAARG
jgi:clumping factor A